MSALSVKLVAQECGISPSTVSRALNGKGDINQKTRKLVLDACAKLGYVRNDAASRLRGKNSKLIACVMREAENELFVEKIHHLKECARGSGYEWGLSHFRTIEERSEVIRSLIAAGVAGIIVDGGCDEASLHLLLCNKVPVVVYDGESSAVDSVFLDREAGIFAAMEHLFSQGRERVVLLGSTESGPRYRAYARAYEKQVGRIIHELLITESFGRNLYEYGYERTLDLIASTRFDAIVAVNDACAIGAIRALSDKGMDVPAQVSVVGFDDIMVSSFANPALTTVRQPVAEMASSTIELLLSRINSPEAPPSRRMHTTELVIRESA